MAVDIATTTSVMTQPVLLVPSRLAVLPEDVQDCNCIRKDVELV